MADVYAPIIVRTKTDGDIAAKITDGTDTLLIAATGEALVTVNTALPTGANTIGEITVGAATTAAGDLAKAEDAVHADGDVGVMALVVRNDVLAALGGADGDYAPLQVNASGALYIQQGAALDVSGANVTVVGTGTFVVQEDGAALTALQLIDNPVQVLGTDTYLEATDSAFLMGVVRNDTLATLASLDNEIAPLQVSAAGALYVNLAEDSLSGNIDIAITASTATVTVTDAADAFQIGDGTNAVVVQAAGADGLLNADNELTTAALLYGFDGTNWDRVYTIADGDAIAAATKGFLGFGTDGTNYQALATDASGNLQVDVLTGGGADSPTDPKIDTLTSAALAAGSSVSLDGTQVASGLTGKLAHCHVSSSVPLRVELRTALNAVYTIRAVIFTKAGESFDYTPPHRDYISQAESVTAGFDGFNVNIKNQDDTDAADVYATLLWDEQ